MDKNKVKDYMIRDVISVHREETALEVSKKMRESGHDGFPVVDGDVVIGYISARDLLFHFIEKKEGKIPEETPIEQLMSSSLIVADPDMDITDATRVIFRSKIPELPVIDEKCHLLGLFTNTDVIRSTIERVTPKKVFDYMTTLRQIYHIVPHLERGMVSISDLRPTQSKIFQDELEGRIYEIKKGLAEPILVVKRPNRTILVDGHHRAIAAMRLGITDLDAYIIRISLREEVGIEKTANSMNIQTLADIKILDYSTHPLIASTHRLIKR